MSLVNDLKTFYKQAGISAKNFHCKHRFACSENAPDFTEATEAYIGKEYERGYDENGGVPRLFFLSLDPGQEHEDEKGRSIKGQRDCEENECKPNELPTNQHWYITHEMALNLLRQFKNDLTMDTVHFYFAHTRSAKCCMNKERNAQADSQLFRNCREFIPGELKALRPDIVVTQGDWAMEAIGLGTPFVTRRFGNLKEDGHAHLRLPHGPTLWIHMYHPNCYGKFWPQYGRSRKKWKRICRGYVLKKKGR